MRGGLAMRPVVVQVFDYSRDGIIGEEEDTDVYKFCRDGLVALTYHRSR
jgi:hypothetical protein